MLYEAAPKVYDYIRKKYGRQHSYSIDGNTIVFAFDPKIIEEICITKYDDFVKDGTFKTMRSVLGEGLLTSEEPKHMNNKRQISKSFSSNRMINYSFEMKDIISDIVKKIQNQKTVNIDDLCKTIVYETVMKLLFSYNGEDLYQVLKNNVDTASDGIAFNNVNIDSSKIVRDICENIVNNRLNSNDLNDDFLGLIIKSYNENKISLQDLYDEAVTIFVSSYETTAYVLSWSILFLSQRPDWQDIFNNEYDQIVGSKDLYKKIDNSDNCRAFLNEVLRLSPPIWNSDRVAIKDTNLGGIPISKGTRVIISSYATHRDENTFSDPYTFKPERWFDISESDLPIGSYIPFLTGKRMCIGKYFAELECKITMLEICKNFQISLVGNMPKEKNGLTYKFEDNAMIEIKRR